MEQQYNPRPEYAAAQERVMPSHLESERGVLGAMLRSREAAQLATESLNPDDFYDPAHRDIYAAQMIIVAVCPFENQNVYAAEVHRLIAEGCLSAAHAS